MKIVIITDAWKPQVNGVVNSLSKIAEGLTQKGHNVEIIGPNQFKTIACPTYPSIRLALFSKKKLKKLLFKIKPESIHIATEGPLGLAGRKICIQNKWRFTTSYHTRFPEYIKARIPIPLWLTYKFLKNFHSAAHKTLVPTISIKKMLESRGFKNIDIWSRGVDQNIFKPAKKKEESSYTKPVMVYVGRVSVEKNIEDFLKININGSKIIIGDGPDLRKLKHKYKNVIFLGEKFGKELANIVASSDVFVFPSLTDTFGIVLIEALACGIPVAAYPVSGPIDIIENGVNGSLNRDLETAIKDALKISKEECIKKAKQYTWQSSTNQFESSLTPIKIL